MAALGAGVLLGVQTPAWAQANSHRGAAWSDAFTPELHPAVSGMVRDASGAPQIGALVELLGPDLAVVARTFTDDRGRYALPHVSPGLYQVKASGSFFLPTLRQNLRLLANSRLVVNLTLNTLYQAFQWLPAEPRPADEPRDDWNWTLRLSTNRPLLRMLDDDSGAGPMVLVSDGETNAPGRRLTVRSGSNRFGEGGMQQDVEIERGHDDAHQLILRTDVGQTESATLRTTAAYLRQLGPGTAMITVASFSDRPDVVSSRDSGLEVLTMRSAMTMAFGPGLEAEVGNELEAVHLGETLSATHPFASLRMHHQGTTISYRIASSPDAEQASELDRDSTLAPRISERDGELRFEQGMHQELSVQHQFAGHHWTKWTTGMTYFHDTVEHPLVGGGVAVVNGRPALSAADTASGDILYDPSMQLIAVSGDSYTGDGIVAIARDQINPDAWISLKYAIGNALIMLPDPGAETLAQGVQSMRPRLSPMFAASFGSKAQHLGTEWRASYRWQPSDTLTQVAPFDSATPEAYLSFHVRQPIYMHYMGVHGMQAIVDVRNLLAQGYRPFLSQDGSTLYFAQAERCVEGGLSFSF
jgi:hypothetical protein